MHTQEQTEAKDRAPLGEHLRRLGIPALAIAFIFLSSSLLQGGLVALVSALAPRLTDAAWFRWAVSLVPMYAVAMPLSMLLFRAVPGQAPDKKELSPVGFFGATCLCFALVFAGNWIGSLVNLVIGALRGEPPVNQNAALAVASTTPMMGVVKHSPKASIAVLETVPQAARMARGLNSDKNLTSCLA